VLRQLDTALQNVIIRLSHSGLGKGSELLQNLVVGGNHASNRRPQGYGAITIHAIRGETGERGFRVRGNTQNGWLTLLAHLFAQTLRADARLEANSAC
jgi:hypothetical protein